MHMNTGSAGARGPSVPAPPCAPKAELCVHAVPALCFYWQVEFGRFNQSLSGVTEFYLLLDI